MNDNRHSHNPLDLFIDDGDKLSYRGTLLLLAVFTFLGGLVPLGSAIDDTLIMRGDAKGFLQHYGVWAFLVTSPIMAILTCKCYAEFLNLLKRLDGFCIDDPTKKQRNAITKTAKKHAESIRLTTNTKYVLYLMLVVGLLSSINNVLQTVDPKSTYGNDVFDAFPYRWGFLANKLYLGVTWTFLYPTVIFVTGHVALSLFAILRRLHRKELLKVDFFSPDQCGGLSEFGRLNLHIMFVYAAIFTVLASLVMTHTNMYPTIEIPLVAFSVFFVAQSILAVLPVHNALKRAKESRLKAFSRTLSQACDADVTASFPLGIYFAYEHVRSLRTVPYTTGTGHLVNVLRISPSLFAVVKALVG